MAEVLVVDDDPDILLLVSFALEDAGHTVRQARDGAGAIAELEQRAPDVMVCDVMMPGIDGFGVLREWRSRDLAPKVRVIILTCKTDERDHLRGYELGAHEYVTKPFDPEELLELVDRCVSTPLGQLEQRRQEEIEKAELLDRLEAAFSRRPRTEPPSPRLSRS